MNRRDLIKAGVLGSAAGLALSGTGSAGYAAGHDKPAFVFIHGAWHGAWTWNKITPLLAAAGYASIAIDLPRNGINAKYPKAFFNRPLDPAAYASETSPVAGSTQDDANTATISAVKQAAAAGNGKVVLVGHSLGGVTITPVAEMVSDLIQSVVYLSAAMSPNGQTPGEQLLGESMKTSMVPKVLLADPAKIGALRIDPASADPAYSALATEAFYGDVDEHEVTAVKKLLSTDEPAQVLGVKSIVTPDNFGRVKRHFIRLSEDRAVVPEGQNTSIAAMDATMPTKTVIHNMNTSHSPFLSAPQELTGILVNTAG